MERDRISKKDGYRKTWSSISSNLPSDLKEYYKELLKHYFRAQVRLAQGKKVKAGRIFEGLDRRVGFEDFEKENEPLFAAIDIAVRGETNRKDVTPDWSVDKKYRYGSEDN